MDPELLKILCCPETRQALTEATPDVVARVNERIAAGKLVTQSGQPVRQPIEGGLVRADGKALYPIRRNLPVLLIDEAIPLAASG
jgi:uncharacterized protein YbaR (Trm112 family)